MIKSPKTLRLKGFELAQGYFGELAQVKVKVSRMTVGKPKVLYYFTSRAWKKPWSLEPGVWSLAVTPVLPKDLLPSLGFLDPVFGFC